MAIELSIDLRPMTTTDIAGCAIIAGLAFEDDRHTLFKAMNPTDPYEHETAMKEALESWVHDLNDNSCTTVAVDHSSGELLGWIAWAYKDPMPETSLPPKQQCSSQDSSTKDQDETTEMAKSSRARVEAYTGSEFGVWLPRLMPAGSRCAYIRSIAVSPRHHGRGVGIRLVSEMARFADERHMFCWVQASQGGQSFFHNRGFQTIGTTTIDLDAWNTDNVVPPEGPHSRWGVYQLPWMRRDEQL